MLGFGFHIVQNKLLVVIENFFWDGLGWFILWVSWWVTSVVGLRVFVINYVGLNIWFYVYGSHW